MRQQVLQMIYAFLWTTKSPVLMMNRLIQHITQMKLASEQKIMKDHEIRLDFARKIVLKFVGENFDYDKMYQDLKDLGDERMKIEHHRGWKQYFEIKAGQKVLSRLTQGSEARGSAERSHHKEPGNKRHRALEPLLGKAKNNFILSSLEKLDPSIPIRSMETVEAASYPPLSGHNSRNRKMHFKRKTTISVENDKKTKEQIPPWVERMSGAKVKHTCAQAGGKEKPHHNLHAMLKRKSVRPPDSIFKLCKSLNWVPEASKPLVKKDSPLLPRRRLPKKRGGDRNELLKEDSPFRKPPINSKLKYMQRKCGQKVSRYQTADPSCHTGQDIKADRDKKKHEKWMAIEDVSINSVELHEAGGNVTREETIFLESLEARPQEGPKALGKDLQEGLLLMDQMRLSAQKNLEDEAMKRTLLETILENILAEDQRETAINATGSNNERKLFRKSSAKLEESTQTTPRNKENMLVTSNIKDKSYTGLQSISMQQPGSGEQSVPLRVPPAFPVVLPVFLNMPNNVQDKPAAGPNASGMQAKVVCTQTKVVSGLEKEVQVDLEVRVSSSSSSSSELFLSTSSSPTTPSTLLSSPGHEARLAAALSPCCIWSSSKDAHPQKRIESMSNDIEFSKSLELEEEDKLVIKRPQVSDCHVGKEQMQKPKQRLHHETLYKGKSDMQSSLQEFSIEKREKAMPSTHVVTRSEDLNATMGTDIKCYLGTDIEGQVQARDTREERAVDDNCSSEDETSLGRDERPFDGETRILELAAGLFSKIQNEGLNREAPGMLGN